MEEMKLYDLEGAIIRVRGRAFVPEVYFGDGNWAPYVNMERLRRKGKRVTTEEAQKRMAAADTPQYDPAQEPLQYAVPQAVMRA